MLDGQDLLSWIAAIGGVGGIVAAIFSILGYRQFPESVIRKTQDYIRVSPTRPRDLTRSDTKLHLFHKILFAPSPDDECVSGLA